MRLGFYLLFLSFLLLLTVPKAWALEVEEQATPGAVQDPIESPDFRLRHHEREKVKKKPVVIAVVTPTPTPFPRLIIGGGVGLDWPFTSWNSIYNVGIGREVNVGFAIDHQWVVGADIQFHDFSGTIYGNTLTYQDYRAHLFIRHFLNNGKIHPYLTLLGGEIWQTSTIGAQTAKSYFPDVNVGGGVEFDLDISVSVYAEGTLDMIFISSNDLATDIPFGMGFRFKI